MTLGEKVKRKREELKLSQEELAEKMNYKSKTSIHKIEQGITDLPLSKVEELAKVLDLKVAYLMGWTEEKQKKEEKSNVAYIYDESEFMMIPLYESISAGYGTDEAEFIEMIAVPGLKPNGTTYYAVKVKGNSMEPKIPNGSIIIIKKDIVIENGEIGAFNLNEENLVKQKKLIKDKLILHSFNLAFDDKVVNEFDDFKEYGKVVKVMVDL
ncbi:helix-turn-helix domain-containing protein [Fusobacterium gastrosuis]|uniref:helix-turn-helix domain-containing protein n=1 Tax=Fusobacterium gastrosuis TaxID=1755100 RepID=UPI0029757878|nr:XRE family transcriptional regulator [Fusobacteriaceae bacterium]MDY5713863.1 XRE family transcriptional regulator [Fusobacterium gastrosuis]